MVRRLVQVAWLICLTNLWLGDKQCGVYCWHGTSSRENNMMAWSLSPVTAGGKIADCKSMRSVSVLFKTNSWNTKMFNWLARNLFSRRWHWLHVEIHLSNIWDKHYIKINFKKQRRNGMLWEKVWTVHTWNMNTYRVKVELVVTGPNETYETKANSYRTLLLYEWKWSSEQGMTTRPTSKWRHWSKLASNQAYSPREIGIWRICF